MAKQHGVIQLEGTLGGITFVKTKTGYFARRRSTLSGDRVKNDASFKRTQENMAEFACAAHAGKVIRTAFRPVSVDIADPNITARLQQQLIRVIRTDGVNRRGERTVQDGELGLLQGFNFHVGSSLSSKLYVQPVARIDREAGTAAVTVPLFAPGKMVSAPEGATHFRLLAGHVRVDFATGDYQLSQARSEVLPLDSLVEVAPELAMAFKPGTGDALLLAFGIEFMQLVNGQQYPLRDRGYNALEIILADQLAG